MIPGFSPHCGKTDPVILRESGENGQGCRSRIRNGLNIHDAVQCRAHSLLHRETGSRDGIKPEAGQNAKQLPVIRSTIREILMNYPGVNSGVSNRGHIRSSRNES